MQSSRRSAWLVRPGAPWLARSLGSALLLAGAVALPVFGADEASAPPAPVAAALFAERLTAENVDRLRVRGADAIGGIDDWAIGNGTLCAVVADVSHETVLSDQGGALIDLGHCARADDQLNLVQPLLNLARDAIVPIDEIEAEVVSDGAGRAREARIVTFGQIEGVNVETSYALDTENPRRLRLRTIVTRTVGADTDVYVFGDVVLHGHRQLAPFTLSRSQPDASVGFVHPAVDPNEPLSMVDAILPADVHVLVGGAGLEHGIAYGFALHDAYLEGAGGRLGSLAALAINGESFTLTGILSRPFWFGGSGALGLLELAQVPFMNVDPGERMIYERDLVVGARSDVASVMDQLWSEEPRVHGRVDHPEVRVSVARLSGAPVSETVAGPNGRFSLRLPSGDYVASVRASGVPHVDRSFSVAGKDVDLGTFRVARHATLELPRGTPMRLVFRGLGETPTPKLRDDGIVFRVGDQKFEGSHGSSDLSLAGTVHDPASVRLPAGRYRVFATRGPEYDVTSVEIALEAGHRAPLALAPPRRVLESPGWLSADLHVHSAASDDSGLAVSSRVASFVAQGLDVVVATEHDRVFDYGPEIRRLGLEDRLDSVVGVEVTSSVQSERAPYTLGHANAFPLQPMPQHYRGGAPRGENRRMRDVVAQLRARPGRPLLQLNHGRGEGIDGANGSFLTHLSVAGAQFQPALALSSGDNANLIEADAKHGLRDLDFDALELLNGAGHASYPMNRADWLSFLLQGEVRTATANSDSHDLAAVIGLPRNYVRWEAGRAFDGQGFADAVRAGRVYGTTGPLLDLVLASADGRGAKAGIGERFEGDAGVLLLTVNAAPWVPVSQARVYVNAELTEQRPVHRGETLRVPLRFEVDSFVTVEVEGAVESDGVYASVAPGFESFAFSNPIYVDSDGDGRWRAPGLPSPAPALLSNPRRRDSP